ncbi:hypothetical protein AeRB84_021401 [Aphanomyces euteiches]|nr:hypothetical protein AeRB84_021401 [Aphanomyces euteiches]
MDLRRDGIPVSHLLLQIKAKDAAVEAGIPEDKFRASMPWIEGFKRRWNFAMRAITRSGKANEAQGQTRLDSFSTRIQQVIHDHKIVKIFNADQTAVNFEMIPTKTLSKEGLKTVWVMAAGKDKERVSVMLMADADGIKYPAFIVMKTTKSKVPKNVQENLQQRNGFGKMVWSDIEWLHENHPSRIYANPTAWWNAHISMQFLKYYFGHREGKDLPIVLLLWDDFSAHFTKEVLAYCKLVNVVIEKIPPSFTWICQPADVAWMKPFKSRIREQWVQFLRQQIEIKRPNERFNLKSPDRFDIVEWINLAWDALPISTIINGFVKCKIILNEELTDDREEKEEANSIDAIDVALALQSQGLLRGQPVDETSDMFFERPISE